MKKGLTEIVFILDRSGSMAGLEQDTIGGFNATIAKQKKQPGEAYISTILFDNESTVIHDRVSLAKITPMNSRSLFMFSVGKRSIMWIIFATHCKKVTSKK